MRFLCGTLFFCLLFASPTWGMDKVLDIKPIISPGKITAWHIQDTTTPVISISFAFRGGISHESVEKSGLARMVSILLDEGAGDLNSSTFQKILNDNSIEMSFSAGRDAFYGELRTLTKYKETAFDLLNLALTKPRFDEPAIMRMKNANLARIQRDMGNPNWLASRTFNGMVFSGHPYAQPGFGTLETIPNITAEDFQNFVQNNFTRDNLIISIVGDISPTDAAAALDKIFGSLPEKSANFEILEAQWQNPGKTIFLPLDIPQTFISVGHPAIQRNHPDWHTAQLINYVLGGGGFGSRLTEEIREKRGLSYGVYSQINHLKYASVWQTSLATKNESAAESLNILQSEWRRMKENGLTEDELKNAKAYLIGALALQLTQTKSIARLMTSLQEDKLPIDYLEQRKTAIEKITLEDANRVARTLLQPDKLTTILVGQPQNIEQNIKIDQTLEKAPGL